LCPDQDCGLFPTIRRGESAPCLAYDADYKAEGGALHRLQNVCVTGIDIRDGHRLNASAVLHRRSSIMDKMNNYPKA
jgi:hypothetical protein